MISLCLQCWPGDMEAAMDLAQLIADIEPTRRPETEFFLVFRRDCPEQLLTRKFLSVAAPKFGRAAAAPARNHDTGYPGGSNMLAFSAFMEMTLWHRQGVCRNEAFLLFESDTLPMAADWLDQLDQEWTLTKSQGKHAFGHWHQQGGPETLHLNGNAVFRSDFFDLHPQIMVGSAMVGWDFFYKERYIELSRDSDLIFQNFNRHGITLEQLASVTKNGRRPAFFHGVKTPDGRANAREMILGERATGDTLREASV